MIAWVPPPSGGAGGWPGELERRSDLTDLGNDVDWPTDTGAGGKVLEGKCPAYWKKVFALKAVLEEKAEGSNRFDWVAWVDDDMFPGAPSEWIEKLKSILLATEKHFLTTRDPDPSQSYTNTGFNLLRNTKEARAVLRSMIDVRGVGFAFNGKDVSPVAAMKQNNPLVGGKSFSENRRLRLCIVLHTRRTESFAFVQAMHTRRTER